MRNWDYGSTVHSFIYNRSYHNENVAESHGHLSLRSELTFQLRYRRKEEHNILYIHVILYVLTTYLIALSNTIYVM